MVSDEHKRRVLAHQEKQVEEPQVVFAVEDTISPDKVERDDGGMALIIQLNTDEDQESGMFVRIQSWDPEKKHEDIQRLFGRRIEVIVRIID